MFDHNRKVAAQIANLTKLVEARVVPSARASNLADCPGLLGGQNSTVHHSTIQYSTVQAYLVASHRSSILVGRWVCSRCRDISWSGDTENQHCEAAIISNIYLLDTYKIGHFYSKDSWHTICFLHLHSSVPTTDWQPIWKNQNWIFVKVIKCG